MNQLGIYQLIDSALPIGSFVYSQGVESAVKNGYLKAVSDLTRYLRVFQDQVLSFEIPFLDKCYEIDNDPEQWGNVSEVYHAMLMNPGIARGSLVLGKSFLRLTDQVYPNEGISAIKESASKFRTHYTIILGLSCAALNIPLKETRQMCLFTSIKDQISALVRLGAVGPVAGQQLMADQLTYASKHLERYVPIDYKNASRSAYLLDIIQLHHEGLYTKLFQN